MVWQTIYQVDVGVCVKYILTKGIGEMMTEGLVANGATVVIASRDGEKNAATAERLNAGAAAHGGHVYALGADLASYQGCDTLVSEVAALVGIGIVLGLGLRRQATTAFHADARDTSSGICGGGGAFCLRD